MSDAQRQVAGLLEEHRHKPPRVQAKLVLDLIAARATNTRPVPTPEASDHQRPAAAFDELERTIVHDPLRRLVPEGIATTRNRTHAALHALGLDPVEVRAVVIEHDVVRVYRYDRPEFVGKPARVEYRRSIPQTMPVLPEETP